MLFHKLSMGAIRAFISYTGVVTQVLVYTSLSRKEWIYVSTIRYGTITPGECYPPPPPPNEMKSVPTHPKVSLFIALTTTYFRLECRACSPLRAVLQGRVSLTLPCFADVAWSSRRIGGTLSTGDHDIGR